MRTRRKTLGIFWIGVSYILLWAPLAFSTVPSDVAQELACPCGCNMVVSACQGTMECSAAAGIVKEITARLNRGESKDEILAFFVGQYGEKILSSPTKKGFNLTAWILPFAAVLFATGIIYFLLKNWTSWGRPEDRPVAVSPEDQPYLERIEKELKTYESE